MKTKRIKIDLLSKEDIDNIVHLDDLNEAMLIVQDKINQDDGGVCGLYWSMYDDSENVWLTSSIEERFNHLVQYLDLEDIYS